MAGREHISHRGKVVEITPTAVSVEIISESACAACHASALCGLSEYSRKCIQVPLTLNDNYSVGEEVNVILEASMGHKAVLLAYGLPLLALIIGLGTALAVGMSELPAALTGIAGVALYYFVLWLFRDKLRTEYDFVIEKLN